jgi:methionine synthase II (cobalamin-independent)
VLLVERSRCEQSVIESKSNFVEHPELIAKRIARYANFVGRDNVIAGSDCGFRPVCPK